MKTISWVGGVALIIGGILTAVLSQAAVGDVVYIKRLNDVTLTGGQATSLVNAMATIWPDVTTANVRKLVCSRMHKQGLNTIQCQAAYAETKTLAQYVALEIQGLAGDAFDIESVGGGNVTVNRKTPVVTLSAGQKTAVGSFATSVLGASDIDLLDILTCERKSPTAICHTFEFVTASPSQYVSDKQAGLVKKAVGVVE